MIAPVTFDWDGEAMNPQARFAKLCDRQFVVGESYRLVVQEERSRETHNHYFASLHDAWLNLPDHIAMDYPTEEHLRKKLLIRAGYANERAISCSSTIEARKIAGWMAGMSEHEYSVIIVRGNTIKLFTPQSQSAKAMGKAVFQQSKQKVLDLAAALIGVAPDTLASQSARSPSLAPEHPSRERELQE